MTKKCFVILLIVLMLCGCSEEKYECECCHTYKPDSKVDYYADENMTICKDCADYALSICGFCNEKFVTARNEYGACGYCLGCIYDGNVSWCGYCGDITENKNMYFEEYCGNCVLSGYDLEVCGWCERPVFSYNAVYDKDEIRCLECYINSLE